MEENKLDKIIKVIVSIVVLVPNGFLIYISYAFTADIEISNIMNSYRLSDLGWTCLFTLVCVLVWYAVSVGLTVLIVIQPTYMLMSKILKYNFCTETENIIVRKSIMYTWKLAGFCCFILFIMYSLAVMNNIG